MEHSGYLAKLDGRLKAGRRKWFVLKGSELKYYKNKEGSFGRPRRTINLSSWCKLATVDELSFKVGRAVGGGVREGRGRGQGGEGREGRGQGGEEGWGQGGAGSARGVVREAWGQGGEVVD